MIVLRISLKPMGFRVSDFPDSTNPVSIKKKLIGGQVWSRGDVEQRPGTSGREFPGLWPVRLRGRPLVSWAPWDQWEI